MSLVPFNSLLFHSSMMKILTLAIYLVLLVWLPNCNAEPQGMDRKIDGSSDEAAKESVEKLATELSATDLKRFAQAYGKIAMRWAFASAFNRDDKKDSKDFLNQINGKTPQEIIQLSESLDSQTPPSSTAQAPPADHPVIARVNLPFNIDGVEILITGIHMGKLQKLERRFSFARIPDEQLLLVNVAMKNTTEGTIIHIQDVWEHSTITDDFGNVYDPPSSIGFDRSDAHGLVSSQTLRPGEAVTDMMVFQLPLENAQKFTLSCNPNFFRPIGNQNLKQLSDQSLQLVFTRADINSAKPPDAPAPTSPAKAKIPLEIPAPIR